MGNFVAKQAFLPPYPATEISRKSTVTWLTTKSKYKIPALLVSSHQNPKWTILFSHGNAEDLGTLEAWLHQLSRSLECDVFGYDYPGYGYSRDEHDQPIVQPTESGAYEAIDAAYAYLTEQRHVPPERIVLMGRSLGSGPTTDLAARKPVRGVILQSPLLSAVRVVLRTWMTLPIDIFANQDKIRKIRAPVFIVHGTQDEVIHVDHGRELHRLLTTSRHCNAFEPWWIDRAGHNDIEFNFFDEYIARLRDFLAHLETWHPPTDKRKGHAT